MTVSIIIAVKNWQNNLEECVRACKEIDFSDFEIIILPDADLPSQNASGAVPVQVIPTGPVSPAEKRDMALEYARGEILAFIDDDVYPAKDWLREAVKNFADPDIAAVGGPAVTPPQDTLRQKASGRVFESFLVSGPYRYRYIPARRISVDDYPSCNFLVRKSVMQDAGGFDTKFWPGEDTKLCLEITKNLSKRIIYDPLILVYHHRRPLFIPHLKQIASYALHRGYFVKRYPGTSLRISYFIPSIFVSGILAGGGFAWFFGGFIAALYLLGISAYLSLALIFSLDRRLYLIPAVFTGTILTHLTYGVYFMKGLFSKRLKEEGAYQKT